MIFTSMHFIYYTHSLLSCAELIVSAGNFQHFVIMFIAINLQVCTTYAGTYTLRSLTHNPQLTIVHSMSTAGYTRYYLLSSFFAAAIIVVVRDADT